MTGSGAIEILLRFHGDLAFFLKNADDNGAVTRSLSEPTSVKDAIESCGVPHPEVDAILVDNTPQDFSYVLRNNAGIDVYPVGLTPETPFPITHLQQHHLDHFIADGHLGKLARNLRLLGFDVGYDRDADDLRLLEIMQSEQRALLTRDRRLLMHSIVHDGYSPRSTNPLEQTIEVIRRFGLRDEFRPFTRCLNCNGLLQGVNKETVVGQLEPLTRIYYHEFRQCCACGKVFWRGSHFGKLESFLDQMRKHAG